MSPVTRYRVARLWIGESKVIDKTDHKRHEVTRMSDLAGGKASPVKLEYIRRDGEASAFVYRSGRGFRKRSLQPNGE